MHSPHLELQPHDCSKPSPSQDRAPKVSRLCDIAAKWRRTRVVNPCAHTLTQLRSERHRHTKHAHISLPLQFGILFLLLLIGMSTNPCGGAYSNAHHHQPRLCPDSYNHQSSLCNPCVQLLPNLEHSAMLVHTRFAQHFRRSLQWSSKTALGHASNCFQKATA